MLRGATPPANFVLPDEVRIEGIYFGTDTSAVDPAWLDVRQFQGVRYMLGNGMGDVVVPQAATSALESITLNAAADGTISFGGTGAITLTAPQITITAGTIIIGEGRTLTINAEGGTLTLNLDDIIISGSATAGSVTLSAAAIVNDAALILNVATVNIAQDGEFGAAAPFTFPAGVTTLNLSTQAAQAYRGWMTAPNPGPDRSVSLMSAGVITVGQSINLETGNLSLNGTGGIVLGGGNIGLAGNTVILTGAIDEAATSTDNLTIAAVDDITLNSNIDLGMGALRLTAGIGSPDGDIVNGGTAPEIIAGSLHLQTDTALSPTLFTTSSRVGGAVALRFGTAVAVQAFSSQTGWFLRLGQGDLSVMGIEGVTIGFLSLDTLNRPEAVVDVRAGTISGLSIQARTITVHTDSITALLSLRAEGALTLRGADGTGSPTLNATITSVTLGQNGAFSATAPLTLPATVTSLTLTTAAAQTVQGWMTTSGRSLSVTSGGVLTVNSDINIGAASLTLAATGTGSIVLNSAALTAGATLTLTGDISFTHANGLTLTAPIIALNGDVVSTNLPFTATASGALSALRNINTGTGDIALTSNTTIGLDVDTTLTGGNVALTISSSSARLAGNNFDLRVNATGNITFSTGSGGINMGTGRFDLRAGGNIINAGTARALTAGDVFLQQTVAFGADLFAATGNNVTGSVSLRLNRAAAQTIHPWMAGLGNGDFSLREVGGRRLDTITVSTALTFTGVIDLRATNIILGAPLTGASVALRANAISGANSQPVAIHATSGEITATRIDASGDPFAGRPGLTGTTSFALTQTTAFGALDTLPFTFEPAEITAITISTRSAQTVQDWMLAVDRDLTITSSANVRVAAAIGSMVPNRNIGAGALTLTSTGAAVRIFADISTTRRLTLSGVIGGINFNNRAAKTLTGLSVTLRGAAVSNRALTITASSPSGFVTISGGINTGTSDLSLSTGSGGGIVLDSGDVELRGGVITLGGVVRGDNNSGLSVFANGNIILGGEIALGSGALTLSAGENGTGNISFLGIAQNQLTVGALTLRQSDAFGNTQFDPDSRATGAVALRLRTAVDQPIHLWMTLLGDGAFSLRGVDGITLTSITTTAALTRSDGPVDLRATTINLGGDVTGNIVGSSDVELVGLTLTATTINLGGDVTANIGLASNANVRLTGVINGSANNRNFSATASRSLTISNDINIGMGTLALTGVGLGVTGSILLDGDITFTGGEIRFIGDFRPSAADINPNFTVNASTSISIRNVNLGTGNLILNNTGATATALGATNTTWTARNITLTGALDASADNRNLIINASGVLTLNNDINLGERNLNINAMGGITLGGNVTLTSRVTILRGAVDGTNGNHNFTIMDSAGSNLHNDINLGSGTFTLANTGSGQVNFSIVGSVGAPLTIEAGNINFMRSNSVVWVLQAGVVAQGADLTLRATGDITFQGTVINLGPGRLEMSADNEGNGTGTIIAANTPRILAGSLLMRHAAAFPADFMADDSAVTGAVDLRITGAMVTQAIHPWMELAASTFTLRGNEGEGARAAVVLTAITLAGAADFGTTDIDLQAAAITLTAATTLTGGAISLTGALTAANLALTITASGLLTLNNDITLGTGILTINADDRINVPNSATRIRAMANNITFTDRLVQSFEAGFTPAGSTTTTFNNMIFIPTATSMFAPSPCLEDPCRLGNGSALTVDPVLEADTSILINAGANALSFAGEGAITITSPTITITAGSIDIGERSLTITAAGGTITLNMLTSITGTGTGAVSLAAARIMGLSSALTVNVPSISIARDVAFGTSAPVTFGAALTSLALTTAGDQLVFNWMIVSGRSLSVTAGNRLTVNVAGGFTLGDSADLTLNGIGSIAFSSNTPPTIGLTARDITLSSEGNITFNRDFTLTAAGDITLNGTFDGSANNRSFSADATGTILIGSTAINLGTGNLNLNSQLGVVLTNVAGLTITAGDFTLFTGAGFLSSPGIDVSHFVVNAGGDITITSITLGTMARIELLADNGSIIANLDSFGGSPLIVADVLLMRQMGIFADGLINTSSSFVNRLELRTTTAVAQPIHNWMRRAIRNEAGTSFSLAGEGVVLNSITTAAAIDFGMTAIDLQATNITLGGDLTAGAVILRTNTITRPNANLTITATVGGITGTRANGTGVPTLDSTVTTLTLTQNSAFGSTAPFAFGTGLTLMLQTGAASQTVQGWMIANGRDLNLTSTGGDITIGRNINVGTADLNLTASGNILATGRLRVLAADTVRLELTGTGAFTTRPFLERSRITTLNITTAAAQDYRGWMAPPAGTNRNLTITAPTIFINSTAINLGTGNLTLNASLVIGLNNPAGLTINVGNFSYTTTALLGNANFIISQFVVVATGDIAINGSIGLPGGRVEFRADNGTISGTAGMSIQADVLSMRHSVAFADDIIAASSLQRTPQLILRITGTGVNQTIHPWMTNLGDGGFRLQGAGGAVLDSITTEAALTRTGRIDLRATAITLGGALTGGEVRLRTNTITGDSANLVAIHAMTGDITATTITDMGDRGTSRPALVAGVRAFSLTRSSAFGGRGSLPFTFADANITAAITLSTRSEQDMRGWMFILNRNLTITSSNRVTVDAAIGDGVDGRDLGNGDLTLGSTGVGIVRIFADIIITGNLTLSSSGTGGINLNSGVGAKTLSGATVTLGGNARSNRDLTLSSGSDEITLGSTLTLTGDSIMFGNAVITGTANASLTIITTSSALTLNNNITLSGTGILDLRSGQGAITGSAHSRYPRRRRCVSAKLMCSAVLRRLA